MAKLLSIAGLAVAGIVGLLFGLDLALGIPFGRQQIVMDAGFLTCAGILGYLGWNAFRDSK